MIFWNTPAQVRQMNDIGSFLLADLLLACFVVYSVGMAFGFELTHVYFNGQSSVYVGSAWRA